MTPRSRQPQFFEVSRHRSVGSVKPDLRSRRRIGPKTDDTEACGSCGADGSAPTPTSRSADVRTLGPTHPSAGPSCQVSPWRASLRIAAGLNPCRAASANSDAVEHNRNSASAPVAARSHPSMSCPDADSATSSLWIRVSFIAPSNAVTARGPVVRPYRSTGPRCSAGGGSPAAKLQSRVCVCCVEEWLTCMECCPDIGCDQSFLLSKRSVRNLLAEPSRNPLTNWSVTSRRTGSSPRRACSFRRTRASRCTISPASKSDPAIDTHQASESRPRIFSGRSFAAITDGNGSALSWLAPMPVGGGTSSSRSASANPPSPKSGSKNTRRNTRASMSHRRADPRCMPAPQAKAEAPAINSPHEKRRPAASGECTGTVPETATSLGCITVVNTTGSHGNRRCGTACSSGNRVVTAGRDRQPIQSSRGGVDGHATGGAPSKRASAVHWTQRGAGIKPGPRETNSRPWIWAITRGARKSRSLITGSAGRPAISRGGVEGHAGGTAPTGNLVAVTNAAKHDQSAPVFGAGQRRKLVQIHALCTRGGAAESAGVEPGPRETIHRCPERARRQARHMSGGCSGEAAFRSSFINRGAA